MSPTTNTSVDASKGAREIDTQQSSSGRGLTKKRILLFVEIVAIFALLAAGTFLWQMQRTLKDELRWARQAEASIRAQTSAAQGSSEQLDHGAEPAPANTLTAGAQLQRVRIPALGIDYRLAPDMEQRGREAAGDVQLALPVAVYGDEVCRLDRLQPGDDIYLETVQRGFSYKVYSSEQPQEGDGGDSRGFVVITGYPCGDQGEQVLVSAVSAAH